MRQFRLASILLAALISVGALTAHAAKPWDWPRPAEEENFLAGVTVAEVTGVLRGTGVIVAINGEARVLTNSHLLQGATTAAVRLPQRHYRNGPVYPVQSFGAKVELDLPLEDIAILIPQGLSNEYLATLARQGAVNANFCKADPISCPKGFHQPAMTNHPHWILRAVLNGESMWRGAGADDQPYYRDNVISGRFERMIVLPLIGRQGMSGGAAYHGVQFAGLISKVDMSPFSVIYAIPTEDIAKLIQGHYFEGSPSTRRPTSRWITRNGQPVIELELEPKERVSCVGASDRTAFAGEAVHSGGEIANGGGEIANGGIRRDAKFWRIEGMYDEGYDVREAVNPFTIRSSQLFVEKDGGSKQIAFFEVPDSSAPGGARFEAPTLPHYAKLRDGASHAYKPAFASDATTRRIEERRALKHRRPKFEFQYKPGRFNYQPMIFKMDDPNDPERNVILPDGRLQLISVWNEQTEDVRVHFAADMRSVVVSCGLTAEPIRPGRHDCRNTEIYGGATLKRTSRSDAQTVFYSSPSGKTRAVMIFRNDDIGMLDRVFIEVPNGVVYEYRTCDFIDDCEGPRLEDLN